MTDAAQGKWILVDVLENDRLSLLAIGDDTYSEASVRKNLTHIGRALILERLRNAVQTRQRDEGPASFGQDHYAIHILPITSPVHHTVVGALAVYHSLDQDCPPAPVVGAWEWEIAKDGAVPHWDRNMYVLYGLESSQPPPASQWVNEMLSPEHRATMKLTIDAGVSDPRSDRHLIPYSIQTADEGAKELQMSARRYVDAAGKVWLRGLTREVNEPTQRITPGLEDVSMADLGRAAFELATDRILAAIDCHEWKIFMTSPSWEHHGLKSHTDGSLDMLVHPDDLPSLKTFVIENGTDTARSITARFRNATGDWADYKVQSNELTSGVRERRRYVLCRLS
ncbi:hypothetical protein [Arthrobacter pigmenti]